MIVSGFRAALDLDTYPLSNLIRPRCTELAKPDRGKPVLIMNISFFACFQAISPERSGFSNIVIYLALVALKLLVSLITRLVACSARIVADKQTNKHTETTTVTLAAHVRRGLIIRLSSNLYTKNRIIYAIKIIIGHTQRNYWEGL